MAATQRPSGETAGLVAALPGARISRGSAVPASPGPSTSTAQIVDLGARSGCGPRSLVKTTVRPSGCQAMSLTPQSPLVTCRGTAPRSRSTTHRCDQRSRWPSSSQRQSMRSIRRARGLSWSVVPTRATGPTSQRGGSTSAVNAIRVPSGDQAISPTPPWRPRRKRAHPAAVDPDQPQRRGRVVVGRVGPDEGDGPPVRRDPRARVADDPAGQDPRPGDRGTSAATAQRHGQEGPVIADPVDRSAGPRRPSSRRATGRAPRRRPGAGCRPGSSEDGRVGGPWQRSG